MQIPDKLMILLLYLARFNCNDGPRVANLQVIYFRLCFDEWSVLVVHSMATANLKKI